MKKYETDIIFTCRKCAHDLYVTDVSLEKLKTISEEDCPSCGEEGYQNWILNRLGNYEREYKK